MAEISSGTVVRRIALFGNFGTGNIGNEGTLSAMLAFVRRACPHAEILCICPEPGVVTVEHGVRAVPIRTARGQLSSPWAKLRARAADLALAVRNVRGVDVLIVPGTGILDDFGEPPRGMPLTLAAVTLVARLRGIPVAFVSIGAGHNRLGPTVVAAATMIAMATKVRLSGFLVGFALRRFALFVRRVFVALRWDRGRGTRLRGRSCSRRHCASDARCTNRNSACDRRGDEPFAGAVRAL